MRAEFQWGDEEEVLKTDSGDGHATSWIHLMPLDCTLNMVKMGNFMLCLYFTVIRYFLKCKGDRYDKVYDKELKKGPRHSFRPHLSWP